MKKLFALLVLVLGFVLVNQAAAGSWTVTTNNVGKYTAAVIFTATDVSNSAWTNYTLTGGFIKNKQTPRIVTVTVITQGGNAIPYNISVNQVTGTNIQVRVRSYSGLQVAYLKFKVWLNLPHSLVR